MRRIFLFVFCVLAAAYSVPAHNAYAAGEASSASASAEKCPQTEVILLGSCEEIPQLTAFKKLLKIDPAAPHFQKTRIEYLLERLSRSSYNFVRDGQVYGAPMAVSHLRYKWGKYRKEVESAEDFADKIANGSRKVGKPYYMKADGKQYLVQEVFHLELRTLDEKLAEFKKTAGNKG